MIDLSAEGTSSGRKAETTDSVRASSKPETTRRSAPIDCAVDALQFDHEHQRLVRPHKQSCTLRAICEVRRDRQLPTPADAHARDAGVPSCDHLFAAERRYE